MDASQFTFQQSTPGGTRGDRELSAPDMIVIVDSLKKVRSKYLEKLETDTDELLNPGISKIKLYSSSSASGEYTMLRVKERLSTARNVIISDVEYCKLNKEEINRYEVEIHKKYSLPAACIVFILIGAPLGMMTRKGGIGVAAGISIVFFLIYWAFLIGGEKLSDRGLLSPFLGMWSANIVLGILGILLTVKAARETITINFSFLQKIIPKNWRMPLEENENN